MNTYIELIWKKIDGSLNREEKKQFDRLIETEQDFADLYLKHARLEKALKHAAVQKAPENLLSNVMQQVQAYPVLSRKYSSFAGIKNIGMAFIGLSVLVIIVILSNPGNISYDGNYSVLGDLIGKLQGNLAISPAVMHYLPYSMAFLAAAGLVWIDNYYRHAHDKLRAV